MGRLKSFLFVSFSALLIGACASVDSQPAPSAATSTPFPTAQAVARPTYTVQRGDVVEVLEFTGRWQPRDQLLLSFETDGTVRRVNVQQGQAVSTGELLADLDIEQLEEQLQDALIAFESAQANQEADAEGSVSSVEDAELSVFRAQLSLQRHLDSPPNASIRDALQNYEDAQEAVVDAERAYYEALSYNGEGGPGAVDSALEAWENAQDNVENARFAYAQSAASAGDTIQSWENTRIDLENDLLLAERSLQEARTNAVSGGGSDLRSQQLTIDRLQEDIDRSTLISTLDGVVLEVSIRQGDSVQAFDPVITVGIPEPLEVVANLPINNTQNLSVELIGVCNPLNRPEEAVQCIIRRLPASARDADQTTRIGAIFDDLTQGTIIEVQMPLQIRQDVLWLPPGPIGEFQGNTFVILETPDGPRRANIEIGLRTTDRVEILSGLQEGDVVIEQ
ncbi:MAG: biotin/lipoyl-binding protein [Aggregatilineales bacterium]